MRMQQGPVAVGLARSACLLHCGDVCSLHTSRRASSGTLANPNLNGVRGFGFASLGPLARAYMGVRGVYVGGVQVRLCSPQPLILYGLVVCVLHSAAPHGIPPRRHPGRPPPGGCSPWG